MISDRIANRITDLIKLAGVSDKGTIDELKDHYLTRIEEEIRRGVNSQKAVRETYQEIANLDGSQFVENQKRRDKRGLFLFFLIFIGLAFYLFQYSQDDVVDQTLAKTSKEISRAIPPSGSPILQPDLVVSSEFGMRLNPLNKQTSLHKGIDIKAKIGTPVVSTGKGQVKEAGYNPKAGNYVTIKHNGNFITNYFHLSSISVTADECVAQGQEIGKVGNSGLSMSPHLHYEVLKDEVPVNPREYIEP